MSSSEAEPDRNESDRNESDRRAPRLVRTRRGRLIGGVCSGLGAHFRVDPILFRIAFVGLTIFAGVGIGLYLAILLLVGEEGASRAPIVLRRSSWASALGVVAVIVAAGIAIHVASHAAFGAGWEFGVGLGSIALIGAGALVVWLRLRRHGGSAQVRPSADLRMWRWLALATAVTSAAILLAVAGAWLAGTERHVAAWAVVVIGTSLLLGAFTRARWLVAPAVAFALPVAIVAAAHVDLHGGVGERSYRPLTLSEARSGYQLGAGRLEIDLRDISFPPGDTPLRVRLGVGEVVILVPDEVCVATRAHIGGGYVGALDRESGGLDVNWLNRPSPPRQVARLVLDGRVGLGALFVADRPIDRGSGFQPGAYGTNSACRPRVGAAR
jgi:phage shock protein PspC (stress-responsive transcriptional regulator)